MFEENKDLVNETENVEETTEETQGEVVEETTEPEKLYTEDDFNKKLDEVLAKKIARKESKLRREYEEKYGRLETVVNTGLGTSNIEEATTKLTDFYKQKGIQIPDRPNYSERDMEILANAEAEDIISSGYNDLVEEVDRLADIGLDNMTPRDKIIFNRLASERKKVEAEKELASIGVGKDFIENDDFKNFANKLNPSLSLKEKYEMYTQIKPKPKVEPIGSMKGSTSKDNGVKEFYTYEESLNFTREDFDRNPELFKAVEKSMLEW